MLKSEIKQWHWAITWDNPHPADSSKMLKALRGLGRVTRTQTKTTVLLAPKAKANWRQIRRLIESNLHPSRGNAFYANLRSQKAFEWGSKTGHVWKKVA
jgi:hypothetical protein